MPTPEPTPPAAPDEAQGAVLVADGVAIMAEAVLPVWGRQMDLIHAQLNQGIGELTMAISSLTAVQEQLNEVSRTDPAALAGTVTQLLPDMQVYAEQALVGLQIGDRLSQMLTVVRSDMQKLLDAMPLIGESGAQQAQAWMDELRAHYTTPEQFEAHDPNAAPPVSTGVEFF